MATGAAVKQRTRNIHHLLSSFSLVVERRTASLTERPGCAGTPILIAGDPAASLDDPEPLAPTTYIGGISGAVRKAARPRVVMPGPERRVVDLNADIPAQALPCNTHRIVG